MKWNYDRLEQTLNRGLERKNVIDMSENGKLTTLDTFFDGLKSKCQPQRAHVFFETCDPQALNTANDSLLNDLAKRGYDKNMLYDFTGINAQQVLEYKRRALFIEYIKYQVHKDIVKDPAYQKFLGQNASSDRLIFDYLLQKYEKNKVLANQKLTYAEKRFIQFSLWLRGSYGNTSSVFDECDAIIGDKSRLAIANLIAQNPLAPNISKQTNLKDAFRAPSPLGPGVMSQESLKVKIDTPLIGVNLDTLPQQMQSDQTEQVNPFSEVNQAQYESFSNDDRARVCYRYLTQGLGFKPHHAVGILANIAAEGGIKVKGRIRRYDTYALGDKEGGVYKAHGMCQRRGARWDNLQIFAKTEGIAVTDYRLQLRFIKHELYSPNFKDVKEKIMSTTDARSATLVFLKEYERASEPHTETRLQYAKDIAGVVGMNKTRGNYDLSSAEIQKKVLQNTYGFGDSLTLGALLPLKKNGLPSEHIFAEKDLTSSQIIDKQFIPSLQGNRIPTGSFVLYGGSVNDVNNFEEITQNLISFVDQSLDKGMIPIVCTIPLAPRVDLTPKIIAYNNFVRAQFASKVRIIDYEKSGIKYKRASDQVHPIDSYPDMADYAMQNLKAFEQSKINPKVG